MHDSNLKPKFKNIKIASAVFFLAIVCTFIFYFVLLYFQNKNENKLQNLLNSYLFEHREDQYISAVSMTVQCNNDSGNSITNSVYAGTLGHGDNPIEKQKLGKDDVFQIGSVTKSFIAVVLLQLENETKNTQNPFNIDDTVGKWFPEEKYKNWREITIRQLLDMTSGIPNESSEFFDFYIKNPYHSFSLEDILNDVVAKPLTFTPGTRYEYSNTNYTLAGLLIERITGNSVESEVTKRVIEPLKLTHTFYPRNFAKDVYPYDKLVHGYTFIKNTDREKLKEVEFFSNKTDTTNFNLSESNSAGAMISTTEDINIYLQALFNPGSLLSESQIQKLETYDPKIFSQNDDKYSMHFALGVIQIHDKRSNEKYYWYIGSKPGFRFTYLYYPNRSLSIVLALNSGPWYGPNNPSEFIQQNVVPSIWQKTCF